VEAKEKKRNGMNILVISQNQKTRTLFQEAWSEFRKKVMTSKHISDNYKDMFINVVFKGAYIAEISEMPLKAIYPLELLKEFKKRPSTNIDFTFVLGEFDQHDHYYLNFTMHQLLLGEILLFDPSVKESPMAIEVSQYCTNPEFDKQGMILDFFCFFFGDERGVSFYQKIYKESVYDKYVS
jgi:hypothetical protein